MPSRGLSETNDADYVDDAAHPDQVIHQRDHDTIAGFVNLFDDAVPPDGAVFFWNAGAGLWVAIDPAISGSPGPQGIQGRGVRPLGPWSSVTAYKTYNGTTFLADDLVTINGDVYRCIVNNTNSAPPSANWQLFASGGVDGAPGADGLVGPDGPPGPPGPSAETLVVIPTSGATRTIDVAAGTVQDITLSTDCVFTLSAPTTGVSAVTVWFHQGAGGNTIGFTNSITWGPAGAPPTFSSAAGETDVVTFTSIDGVWWAFPVLLGAASPLGLLAVDIVGTIVSSASGVSFASGVIDIDPDDLVIVGIVTLRSAGTPTTPVPTGMGITTWTEAFTTNIWNTGAQNKALSVFLGQQASPGAAAALTIGYGGVTQTGCLAIIARIKNATAAAKTLADTKAVVANNVGVPSTSISVALAAAGAAANRAIAFLVSNDLNGFNPRASWTELTDITLTTPVSISLQAQWRSDAFETTASGAKTAGGSGPLGIAATELEQG